MASRTDLFYSVQDGMFHCLLLQLDAFLEFEIERNKNPLACDC